MCSAMGNGPHVGRHRLQVHRRRRRSAQGRYGPTALFRGGHALWDRLGDETARLPSLPFPEIPDHPESSMAGGATAPIEVATAPRSSGTVAARSRCNAHLRKASVHSHCLVGLVSRAGCGAHLDPISATQRRTSPRGMQRDSGEIPESFVQRGADLTCSSRR